MKTWIANLSVLTSLIPMLLYFNLPVLCLAGTLLGTSEMLVGRWKCRVEYGSWIIERKANGTFEKKGKLVQTLGQPPQDFTVKGRWRLVGNKYIEIWDQVSPKSWSELTGSTRRSQVLLLERDKFRRIQADSPVFIETRIR